MDDVIEDDVDYQVLVRAKTIDADCYEKIQKLLQRPCDQRPLPSGASESNPITIGDFIDTFGVRDGVLTINHFVEKSNAARDVGRCLIQILMGSSRACLWLGLHFEAADRQHVECLWARARL